MLKQMFLIHPLGQAVAFVFGVFNLVTGWTRKCFLLPLHINLGVMFYVLTCMGAGIGFVVARRAALDNINLMSPVHGCVAAILFLALFCALLSGFLLLARKGKRTWMHVIHRYSNLAVVLLFALQAITGLKMLVAVL